MDQKKASGKGCLLAFQREIYEIYLAEDWYHETLRTK